MRCALTEVVPAALACVSVLVLFALLISHSVGYFFHILWLMQSINNALIFVWYSHSHKISVYTVQPSIPPALYFLISNVNIFQTNNFHFSVRLGAAPMVALHTHVSRFRTIVFLWLSSAMVLRPITAEARHNKISLLKPSLHSQSFLFRLSQEA